MTEGASNFVHGVDKAFYITLGISFFFFVLIIFLMIFFVIKYNRKKNIPAVQIKESSALEITWTVVPLILVIMLYYFGYVGYAGMRSAPKDAMVVKTIGKMWTWEFVYEGNKSSPDLVIPINKAVKLDLYSPDVLHSLFIPAFRIKEDVVPRKNNFAWFIPQELGEFEILCTEYCGLRHSYMEAKVKVVTEDQFKLWLAGVAEKKPEKNTKGLAVIKKNNCLACHSLDGTKIVGPSFKGLYGSEREVISNGTTHKITADDEYIKNSILNPNKDVVVGFNQGIMQPYGSVMKKDDIKNIIEYLKEMNETK